MVYNKKMTSWRWLRILGRCIAPASIFIFLIVGCFGGGTVKYINPDADFSYIKKVAVLPFNNMSADRNAGEKLRSALTIELLSRVVFDVMEEGEVTKILRLVLRGTGVEEGMVVALDKETLKLIGERLGVQAVILGNVEEFGETGGVITVSMRMLDASSGAILWHVRTSVSSKSVMRGIIGIEAAEKSTVMRKVVKTALDTLL